MSATRAGPTCIAGDVDELLGEVEGAVVVDAALCDDEAAVLADEPEVSERAQSLGHQALRAEGGNNQGQAEDTG